MSDKESALVAHRVDCERALVSIALKDPVAAIDKVLSIVRPSDFADRDLGAVYDVLSDLHQGGFGLDLDACAVELRKRGIVERIGKHELRMMLQAGILATNAEFYASEVARLSDHRKLIRQAELILATATDVNADPQYLRDRFEAGTRIDRAGTTAATIGKCVADMHRMHANALTDENSLGIPTGFPSLDKATSGLHRGQLWLLAARSNTGKTAFALSVAGNLASGRSQARKHVVFFSLEMSKVELAERVCADECGVNYGRFNHSSLEQAHLQKIANHEKVFEQWQFVVDDKSSLTVDEIAARARILSPSRGPDLVIVDTLQRVRPRNLRQERRLQLQQIANDLKDLAKNLNCCVLLCAQLNADAEGKEPDLTHLSEGKQVIEPCDTAVLMHRPNREDSGVVLKIEKLRRGARKKITIDFDGKFQRFTDRQSVDVAPTREAWQS